MSIDRAPPVPTRSSYWSGNFTSQSVNLKRQFPGTGKEESNPFRWLPVSVFLFGGKYFEAGVPTIAFEVSGFHLIIQLSSNGQTLIGKE